ncbi:MAG: SRPBCC family protein [Bacteroidetes bacterium]|nr:SRPBCC family protein [Bacteroidota bacterium]
MYELKRIQQIPITIEKAWDFFSKPENLAKITPSYMNFDILSRSDAGEMYPGMIISYRVSPLFNISVKWATEITQVRQHKYFIDNQIKGPYKIWHHEHHFKEIEGGIEMRDILFYEIPYGFLGKVLYRLMIKNRVEEIFNFRSTKIKELFGSL